MRVCLGCITLSLTSKLLDCMFKYSRDMEYTWRGHSVLMRMEVKLMEDWVFSSSYSLRYTRTSASRSRSLGVRYTVLMRHSELLVQHCQIRQGEAQPLPLLLKPPGETRAVLICRVVAPLKAGLRYKVRDRKFNYCTTTPARVLPHFLVHVHVGQTKVEDAQQPRLDARAYLASPARFVLSCCKNPHLWAFGLWLISTCLSMAVF